MKKFSELYEEVVSEATRFNLGQLLDAFKGMDKNLEV